MTTAVGRYSDAACSGIESAAEEYEGMGLSTCLGFCILAGAVFWTVPLSYLLS